MSTKKTLEHFMRLVIPGNVIRWKTQPVMFEAISTAAVKSVYKLDRVIDREINVRR